MTHDMNAIDLALLTGPLPSQSLGELVERLEAANMALVAELAKARETALREAASIAFNACLVPPDGGNPTEAERLVCEEAGNRILALIQETTHD